MTSSIHISAPCGETCMLTSVPAFIGSFLHPVSKLDDRASCVCGWVLLVGLEWSWPHVHLLPPHPQPHYLHPVSGSASGTWWWLYVWSTRVWTPCLLAGTGWTYYFKKSQTKPPALLEVSPDTFMLSLMLTGYILWYIHSLGVSQPPVSASKCFMPLNFKSRCRSW